MKTRLAVIWAAIIAAGVTAFGVLTGRRRRRRAEREKAREERRARRAQRKAQGGRKRAASTARAASVASGTSSVASGARATDATTEPPAPTAKAGSEDAAATAAADAAGDDLQAIKGLGAVTAGKLRDAGITTYAQIAAWSPEEAQELAGRLGLPPGRIAGEDWVGQARRLVEESRSS